MDGQFKIILCLLCRITSQFSNHVYMSLNFRFSFCYQILLKTILMCDADVRLGSGAM